MLENIKKKRVFLVVLDSFGIGELPDAEEYGDRGANTLLTISHSPKFSANNLISLGLAHIDGVSCLPRLCEPRGAYARLRELSAGKDTTTGHFEMMGIVSDMPMPTYPDGFPVEILKEFSDRVGREILCNKPYSGTDVIRDFGEEHLKTGKLIVYTSADSVFQIAAHEDVVPIDELYEICRVAREILQGEHAVGRVIARPFSGEVGNFYRTANRRDFSLPPPKRTYMEDISNAGLHVISVGKIYDIFVGRGISTSYPTHSNSEGMDVMREIVKADFSGLCFVNLVDFDMLFGHRQDADGYARAISELDDFIGEFLPMLGRDDALIITADHGCDPGDQSTDHTREFVPLLIYGSGINAENLGTIDGLYTAGKIARDMLI